MYKVMIVDDEIAVREKLPKIINFNAYGFEVCATAKNGMDAMEKLFVCKPDLIFLDVRMPVMDGLSFLEKIKKTEYKDTAIIILSGYSDFEYARKAIEYGVKAYLTKPIDEDEAAYHLSEVCGQLDEIKNNSVDREYKNKFTQLKMILSTGGSAGEFSEYLIVHVVLISVKAEYENIYPFEVINACVHDNLEIPPAYGEALLRKRGSVFSYLIPKKSINGKIEEQAHKISAELSDKKLNCSILADFDTFNNNKPFKQIFSERLHNMLTDVFYNTDIDFIEYQYKEKNNKEEEAETEDIENNLIDCLKQALSDLNKENINLELENFFNRIKENQLDMIYIQKINYRIYYTLLDIIKSVNGRVKAETILSPPEWRDYATFISFEKWKQILTQQIDDVYVYAEQSRTLSRMGICGEILEYVHVHFNEHITIKDVADTFHINSAYLGRIFQKATGINFKKYINDLRIQEAKRLLLHTDKLIYEIANESGFTESSYFISKFTGEVGISPSDYRKQF